MADDFPESRLQGKKGRPKVETKRLDFQKSYFFLFCERGVSIRNE